MTKIAGSGSTSRSISQKHGSAGLDPHQNGMDPEHCKNCGRPRPSHGVDNRFRLLKDLLVHEAGEVALHDLLDLQHDGGDLPALGRLQVNAPADPAATLPCVLKNLGFNKGVLA
jgi:hypothetical protein